MPLFVIEWRPVTDDAAADSILSARQQSYLEANATRVRMAGLLGKAGAWLAVIECVDPAAAHLLANESPLSQSGRARAEVRAFKSELPQG